MSKAIKYLQSAFSQHQPLIDLEQSTAPPREIYTCGPMSRYRFSREITLRISFDITRVTVYGWPSRGGLMTLEDASPADLDFLGLDRLDPPMQRHESPEEEDAFCKRFLLLGAKWWDSNARYMLLNHPDVDIVELDESDEPMPTMRERFWVSVAWPSTDGLVVSEFDTNMYGVGTESDGERLVPPDAARLRLCTSMDEKAQLLMARFEGRKWDCAEGYVGHAFLGCWEIKETGEVGEFQRTWPDN